jgi:hypothetical protein
MEQVPQSLLDPVLRERLTDEEFEALSAWCENAECSIEFVQWLGGGRSGAQLAVVFVGDDYGPRKAVLKYCPSRANQPPRDHLAFKNASNSGPSGFAKAHLVGLDPAGDKPILNRADGLFLLMEYRTQGYHQYDTMALLLDREVLGTACKTIMMQILVKWNRRKVKPKRIPGGLAAKDFLREILGSRCEPGGSVHTAVGRLEASDPSLYLTNSGQELPRPLAAVILGEQFENVRLFGFRGNAHGDLHVDNILVPILVNAPPSVSDFEKFILIDLSTFSDNRLLAVDPAHLLLSIIARRLPDLSAPSRDRLSELVLDPEHGESGGIPTELAQAVHAIHWAGTQFAEPRRHLYNEWRTESLTAILGCALLFVGRDLPDQDRRWFLRLAAMAIGFLGSMPGKTHIWAVENDASSKNGGLPRKMASSRGRGLDPDNRTPASRERNLASDSRKREVVPIRGGMTSPEGVSGDSLDAAPVVVDEQAESCTELTNELALEISSLSDDLPTGEGLAATTTARAIIEELTTVLEEMKKWHDGHRSERHVTYITAIEAARIQLGDVAMLLLDISKQGTTPSVRDELADAAELLQAATRDIAEIDKPGQPPDP